MITHLRVLGGLIMITAIIAAFSGDAVMAQRSTGGNFTLEAQTINGGGAYNVDGNFELYDTVGEQAVGNSTGGNFDIVGGFQQVPAQCNDGLDNDADGSIDLADADCASAADNAESGTTSSGGGGGGGGSDPDPDIDPTCSLNVNPTTITTTQQATLSWSGVDVATSGHTISPDIGAVTGTSGDVQVSPGVSTTYTGIFTDSNGDTFSCDSATLSVIAASPGVISLVADSVTVSEDGTTATLGIARTGGSDGQVSVGVATTDGSAVAGADYSAISQNFTWPDQDDSTKIITISILDDDEIESTETFSLALSNLLGASAGAITSATVQINDDDVLPPPAETATITIIKNVINDDSGTLSAEDFDFTVGGVAANSGDTITINANEPVRVRELGDSDYEFISITGSGSCPSDDDDTITLATDQAITCTYTNDDKVDDQDDDDDQDPDDNNGGGGTGGGGNDPDSDTDQTPIVPSVISLVRDNIAISENGQQVTVPVVRSGGDSNRVRVRLSTNDGTAVSAPFWRRDFSNTNQRVVWEAGESGVKNITVPITPDDVLEDTEFFTVNLSLIDTQDVFTGAITTTTISIIDVPPVPCVDDECAPEIIKDVVTATTVVAEAVTKNPVAPVATATGVVAAGASAAAAVFSSPYALAEIILIPYRIWTLLLSFLRLRRRNRPWGTVYDSQTKQPLDPAYVVLTDLEGKEVATSITDLDGRFGFHVQPGDYYMTAKKTNYMFPSVKLAGKLKDELYDDLYFGEKISVTNPDDVIIRNIPLDPQKFDWNEFAKRNKKLMNFYSKNERLITAVLDVMFWLGLLITAFSVFVSQTTYNIILGALYAVMLVLRSIGIKRKKLGRVAIAETNNPLSYAVVKILLAATGQRVARRVCDKFGRYYALISNGVYKVSIEHKQPDGTYIQVYTSDNIEIKSGILHENFIIDQKAILKSSQMPIPTPPKR